VLRGAGRALTRWQRAGTAPVPRVRRGAVA
jgi:osmoprotectant transport system permease protein